MSNRVMKWIGRSVVCALAVPVSVALVACGAEGQAVTDETSAVDDGALTEVRDLPSSDDADSMSEASAEGVALEPGAELSDKARNCEVSCGLSGSACTAAEGDTVSGFGSTSFLGGCDKCYRRAIDDARVNASAFFPGCTPINCVRLYCD